MIQWSGYKIELLRLNGAGTKTQHHCASTAQVTVTPSVQ